MGNLMHRDLKPENCFFLERPVEGKSNKARTLVLGDFDTAKSINKNSAVQTVIGTPGFMAPEVLDGKKEQYGYSADIYSFAMVLYVLITLKMPFEDMNPLQSLRAIGNGEKPTMPDYIPQNFAPLTELYALCAATDPKQRPSTTAVVQGLQSMR